jgi:hypothetical protein
VLFAIVALYAAKHFFVGEVFGREHTAEEVEVVAHDAEAEDLDEEDGGEPADEGKQIVFFLRAEDEAVKRGSGDDVIRHLRTFDEDSRDSRHRHLPEEILNTKTG